MRRFPLLILAILCFDLQSCSAKDDEFHEELYAKSLQTGHVYFHFQFTTKWNVSVHNTANFKHFRLFPKSLGEVLTTYHVQELHLTQTQGKWRHQSWGYPVEDSPPGAQLWVWFKPTVKAEDVDKTWADLVNAVSGLFCSSLNFLDGKSTVAPVWSFRPRGATPKGYNSSPLIRYGALPREIVCTENLTPWKKLLPCDSKVGLATLFRAEKLHDSEFHSLGLHFRPVCADKACNTEAVELTQTLSLVTETALVNNGYPNWSIRRAFGVSLVTQCPLASSSKIFVDTTENQEQVKFSLTPPPNEEITVQRSNGTQRLAVYNIGEQLVTQGSLSVSTQFGDRVAYGSSSPPPVFSQRYITGFGLENGGVSCLITNTLTWPVRVLYMDTLPWFTRVFFKSVAVERGGVSVPYKAHYVPGRDRERSYHLELSFNLAPSSVTRVSFQFERAFLKWTEYPPDANHGFYINSAVISFQLPADAAALIPSHNTSALQQAIFGGSQDSFIRLYTEALLVSLPTPDFSMPYNVICLACTVVAIAFGSLHNLTTRSFVLHDPAKKKGLLQKLKAFFLRGKKEGSDAQREESGDVALDSQEHEKEEGGGEEGGKGTVGEEESSEGHAAGGHDGHRYKSET